MPDEQQPPPSAPVPLPPPVRGPGSIFGGTLFGFALNIGGIIASIAIATAMMGILEVLSVPFFAVAAGIGLGQFLWIVPLYLRSKRTGATETAKGLVIAAAITFLLNAGCWGLIMGGGVRFAG
jgi:hypothetical protein